MTTYAVAREVPEANHWREWKPSKDGEAPPDWQDGWECEFLEYRDTWSVPAAGSLGWYKVDTYRYRPRTVAEPAQVEQTQPECFTPSGETFVTPAGLVAENASPKCDHPNADDYRNRAERAEAELAELRERVRKLEALVCDQLLEGDKP